MVYVKFFLETRRKRLSGIYPVKLRITSNRIQKYYLTGYSATENDFEEVMKEVPPKKLQSLKVQLNHIELKAKTVISKLEAFSFRSFEEKFYENQKASRSIYELFIDVINEKMTLGKISTAINYRCSMKSLQLFAPNLSFIDVTPKFLKCYEKQLLLEKKSISTIGIYLRPLRAIINEAISNKYLPRDNYPFGLKKYVIPESRNIKKALTKEDFKKIINYTPLLKTSYEARSINFWVLSYLCQGMNMKDLLLLKRENIEEDFIRFIREKTKDTVRRNIMEITVPLLPEIKEIIGRWESSDADSKYVFDLIKEEMSPVQVYKKIQQFVKVTNKHMSQIAAQVGIQKRVTCYVARYQFTKAMIDADMTLEYLRQCLGHQNFATTQRYIGSFENNRKYEIASKHLLNFD